MVRARSPQNGKMVWAPLDFGLLLLLLLPSVSGDPGCFDTPDTGRCCVSGADIASADSPRPLPPPPSAHFSGSCGFLAGVAHYCPLTLRLRRASGVVHGTPSLPARKAPLAIVNSAYSVNSAGCVYSTLKTPLLLWVYCLVCVHIYISFVCYG